MEHFKPPHHTHSKQQLTRMSSTAADIQSLHPTRQGAHAAGGRPTEVQLVDGHGPMEDVATGQAKDALEVLRSQHFVVHHQVPEARGISLYPLEHCIQTDMRQLTVIRLSPMLANLLCISPTRHDILKAQINNSVVHQKK